MLALLLALASAAHAQPRERTDIVATLYAEQCAVCHGDQLQGAAQGPPLIGADLKGGHSVDAIAASTAAGAVERGMPAWRETLTSDQIHALALYIAERRQGTTLADFRYNAPFEMSETRIRSSQHHHFQLKTVVAGLDPQPYGLAVLPDGRFLVTEKMRGLKLISADGKTQTMVSGAPQAYADSMNLGGQPMGLGWLMDVVLHPDFAANGWIYLSFGDRCENCNAESRKTKRPVSMVKLVRGRLDGAVWVDQQTIWQADIETYNGMFEIAAGGRIAFDSRGHVFLSIGMKGPTEIDGFQDLSLPYGKILRLTDDGRVPVDNPFVSRVGALGEIWSYGHRSPQGLEVEPATGVLWGTEMGPRGGDEVNLIRPGRNYGWPLVSKGVNYDGRPLDNAAKLGISFDLKDIEQPVVDLTPSPAVSSFVFYRGEEFPAWRGNMIVGTLRASDLMRMDVNNGRVLSIESLIEDLARIRDVAEGPQGELYLLLEHNAGSRVVRLVRAH